MRLKYQNKRWGSGGVGWISGRGRRVLKKIVLESFATDITNLWKGCEQVVFDGEVKDGSA